jgi:hypothetical protein
VPINRIRELQRKDSELSDLITFLETDALPANNERACSFVLYGNKFYLDDNGLLFFLWTPDKRTQRDVCSQLVIPDALKHEVLVWPHDDVTAGHLGTQKTYGKIHTSYYRRNMFRDVDRWRKSCVDCAMKKSPRLTDIKTPFFQFQLKTLLIVLQLTVWVHSLCPMVATVMFSFLQNTSLDGLRRSLFQI